MGLDDGKNYVLDDVVPVCAEIVGAPMSQVARHQPDELSVGTSIAGDHEVDHRAPIFLCSALRRLIKSPRHGPKANRARSKPSADTNSKSAIWVREGSASEFRSPRNLGMRDGEFVEIKDIPVMTKPLVLGGWRESMVGKRHQYQAEGQCQQRSEQERSADATQHEHDHEEYD